MTISSSQVLSVEGLGVWDWGFEWEKLDVDVDVECGLEKGESGSGKEVESKICRLWVVNLLGTLGIAGAGTGAAVNVDEENEDECTAAAGTNAKIS